jgi:hypothetical protein
MKLKLRYIIVFVLGMACMYWMVRANIITIEPIGQSMTTGDVYEYVTSGEVIASGDLSTTGDVLTWSIMTWSDNATSGSTLATGLVQSWEQQIDVLTWAAISVDEKKSAPHSKNYACTQPTGTYTTPLEVSRNNTLTASTKWYVKLNNRLHYVVYVQWWQRYYYYHDCATGIAKNAKDLTNTTLTRVVISQGQVHLR